MRVLLGCSLGGEGHLLPLAHVGRAIERAGHEALIVVPPALADSVRRTGLPHRVGNEPPRAFVDGIWERVRAGPASAVSGVIDRELFADRCTQAMLPVVRDVRDGWRPDLVVREPCEYACAVAAHEARIPQAQVAISLASIESGVRAMVAPVIDRFARGVADAIGAATYLSSFPPSLDPSPWPRTRRFRVPAEGVPERGLPDWCWDDDERPLVYVTFGSVLGHLPEASGVYRAALDAVAGVPARALVTVGRATDPASVGPVPDNARIERWVPQGVVLPRAAVVVCHGGSGTTFGALAAGVPLVICPLFADQPHNARAVQAAGAAVVIAGREGGEGGVRGLGPQDVAPLRDGIARALREPAYHRAAGRIAAEMGEMPSVGELVGELV